MPYSNDKREISIPEGCPWAEAQRTYGAPNVKWCEATQCSWINEPANTWSNLGYILIGFYLIRQLKNSGQSGFGWMVLFMGALSFIYHATNNFLTQYFDFIGMFLMMSYLGAFHLQRGFSLLRNFATNFWALMFGNAMLFTLFMILDLPAQPLMLINALPIVVLDVSLGWRDGRLRDYRFFFLSVIFLALAQAFAIVDIQRIYCQPENLWLHGHVLWHLLGSVGMLFAGQHLRVLSETPPTDDLRAG